MPRATIGPIGGRVNPERLRFRCDGHSSARETLTGAVACEKL